MAENEDIEITEEDIVIIEETSAAGFDSEPQKKETVAEKVGSKPTKKIAVTTFFILLIVAIYTFLSTDEEKSAQLIDTQLVEKKLKQKPKKEPIEPSRLDKMIKKANILYTNGHKEEALSIFEEIALYSESISYYNLGVVRLKKEQYESAIEAFKKAINNNEHVCVSAINAAISALKLNKPKLFNYYIDLAQSKLPEEVNAPLYPYYYALVHYYKRRYPETLMSLKYSKISEYESEQNHMSAAINVALGQPLSAIDALEKSLRDEDRSTLGMLYANTGDLKLAKKHLIKAIQGNIEPIRSQIALAMVNIKSGEHRSASIILKDLYNIEGENIANIYPIEVILKKSLFDVDIAQKKFKNQLIYDEKRAFSILFYFAPYKIFNPMRTLSTITKGSTNIFLNDYNQASLYLKSSSSSSKTNYIIAKAVKEVLGRNLLGANRALKEIVEKFPKNDVAQYNLGLTYAQLGNFQEAHKHFLRSYYLDSRNYQSGIFALMSAKIIAKNSTKLREIIKENLAQESESEINSFYRSLLSLYDNNLAITIDWLDYKKREQPFYTAFDLLIATITGKDNIAINRANELIEQLPKNSMAHMLYMQTAYANLSIKKQSKKMLEYMKRNKTDIKHIFNGPVLEREFFIYFTMLTGGIYPLREALRDELSSKPSKPVGIIQGLALTNIYQKAFEEAYTLYNELIDTYKQQDEHTLFLGAVASIAAGHHANAIALLELAKLKNPSSAESRYALAILYMEAKNYNAASIQLAAIGDSGFKSDYFSFKIDSNAIKEPASKKLTKVDTEESI